MTDTPSTSEAKAALMELLAQTRAITLEGTAHEILSAIRAGKVPGIIASAPPCARMCEAQAVKVTMESLRVELNQYIDRNIANFKRAESFAEALRLTAGFVGARVGPECTDMFHRMVPAEVDLVVKNLHATIARLESLLRESLRCLKEAKRMWAPSTTNSDADCVIARIDDLLTPKEGARE